MSNLEKAVQDLQDNLVVLAEIERRQSALLREHSEMIVDLVRLNNEAAQFRVRTEQNLAEITDKLNRLIGYMDGQDRPRH